MSKGPRRENVFADKALQNYLRNISKFKPLSRKEEHELALKARDGDTDAMNQLIQANLKFVVKIAARYQNRGLPLSELISEGNIGLIKAIEKFDPDKNIKLISYAIWWIKQRITLAVSEKSSLIRVPLGKSSTAHRIKATKERVYSETGRKASTEEIADFLNITEKSIELIKTQIPDTFSYDDVLKTNDFQDFSTRDLMHDTEALDPQQLYRQERLNKRIHKAIDKLEKREAEIIRTYFGLNEKQESKNFAQIAEVMGLSRERVRQIQKEALKKILVHMKPEEDAFLDEFIEHYDY
ncbi:MAG: RNA polymerase sigma factor RpoD/SigA [Candidatus Cloacimonadaceae bacterium]|jgi:RNA polymerase primary sigma factor|nr:RNA polymerase sigma factor RpoD/SigA [Candidatus Cloacimonadota bacterium]MCK9242338.1 RNA polymerase sigma factor RpoD/SigA [Candidatus Cloacimonadota bacterium]MDD3103206.1 RNA polymerase sigma factor RpoD/SigA [Candidatus Cloacimonadota bacterium]MDD3533631.1 RNA polymerase sigma factor RpoD/SigA [Candidatus Cloacimonadota bacterium]MDY0127817.1 RNA polymerase sigma factor RpoD/SigA [Candidatus Cloacimonadaceae bacterium]